MSLRASGSSPAPLPMRGREPPLPTELASPSPCPPSLPFFLLSPFVLIMHSRPPRRPRSRPLFCLVPLFGGSPFLMRPSTIRSAPPAVRPSMDARPGGPGRPAGQTCMLLTLLSVASSYSRVSHVRNCATAAEAVRSQISLDVTVRRRVTGPSR